MSERTTSGFVTPFQSMFEVQRIAVEAGQQMLDQSASAQQNAADGVLAGLRAQEASQRWAAEVSRFAVKNYLDAIGTMMTDGNGNLEDVKRTVDEWFDEFEEVHEEAFDAIESNLDSYDEFSKKYVEAQRRVEGETVRSAERAARETVDAVEETAIEVTEGTSDAMAEAAETSERATQSNLHAAEDVAETATGVGLARRIHGIGEVHAESLAEASIESLEDLAEAQADAVAEAAGVSEERAREWINRAGATYAQDVDLVDGIGNAHAEDLHAAGITTIADLAEADAARVAEAAGVSEEHAQEWIDDAQSRQEEGLEVIDGIGESRAERLRGAGIETLADLAASDTVRIAEAAGVSEDRAQEWIEAATH